MVAQEYHSKRFITLKWFVLMQNCYILLFVNLFIYLSMYPIEIKLGHYTPHCLQEPSLPFQLYLFIT